MLLLNQSFLGWAQVRQVSIEDSGKELLTDGHGVYLNCFHDDGVNVAFYSDNAEEFLVIVRRLIFFTCCTGGRSRRESIPFCGTSG